jgi:signal transduction histidine kinase
MPTDLRAVSARIRKAQAQTQTDITMALVWFVIVLVNLVLLFADQSFAKALELMGQF